jgi:hypothetical protein
MTDTKTQLPMGKLGGLDVSRIILGGNLLALYHHCRDQNYVFNLVKHYNTEEKLLETFELAEANGINTMTVHTVDWTLDLFKKHRDRGGKMQWIFCPTAEITDDLQVYKDEIARLVDLGANAFHIWGEHNDVLLREGKVDVIAELMGIIRSHGVPVGVGAHDINVVVAVEERGFDPDFYVKTFHHHDYPTAPKDPAEKVDAYTEVPGYWDRDPDMTREVMSKVTKPWVAFKTMAAGTIPPESAFQFAFEGGADFIYAGMFDYDIEEDVEIATRIITDLQANGRARGWM